MPSYLYPALLLGAVFVGTPVLFAPDEGASAVKEMCIGKKRALTGRVQAAGRSEPEPRCLVMVPILM